MNRAALTLFGVTSGLCLAACEGPGGSAADSAVRPTSRPLETPTRPFVDVTSASNIAFKVGYTRPSLIPRASLAFQVTLNTFGGTAAGDCDNDGDIDLFVTYGNTGGPDGGGGPNRLYLNQLTEQGNGLRFEDVAGAAGVANTRPDGRNDRHSGPTFADMDGDGDLDLLIGGLHGDPNKIYENQGDCRFRDVTSSSPDLQKIRAPHTGSAAFGDYDLDGDLDMFLTHWGTPDSLYAPTGSRSLETDHLWRNESDESGIRFVNVSEESGISGVVWLTRRYPGTLDFPFSAQEFDFTFAPTFARINDDVWPDIAIAADFGTTQLAINYGDGTFRSLENPILRGAEFAMGSATSTTTAISTGSSRACSARGTISSLHRATACTSTTAAVRGSSMTRSGTVSPTAPGRGERASSTSTTMPISISFTRTAGRCHSSVIRSGRLRSRGPEAGTYTDEARTLGLAESTSGRSVVRADFDNDGDIDILEVTDAAPNSARLWENRTAAAGRHFLRIKLEGLPPNTEAAGARIFVRTGATRQMREITIGSNYTSQNPTVQIFGLDSSELVDEIFVEWPPVDSEDDPEQLGSVLNGPIAAGRPGETLVIRHPRLPAPIQ